MLVIYWNKRIRLAHCSSFLNRTFFATLFSELTTNILNFNVKKKMNDNSLSIRLYLTINWNPNIATTSHIKHHLIWLFTFNGKNTRKKKEKEEYIRLFLFKLHGELSQWKRNNQREERRQWEKIVHICCGWYIPSYTNSDALEYDEMTQYQTTGSHTTHTKKIKKKKLSHSKQVRKFRLLSNKNRILRRFFIFSIPSRSNVFDFIFIGFFKDVFMMFFFQAPEKKPKPQNCSCWCNIYEIL